jgi:hypothetical protein
MRAQGVGTDSDVLPGGSSGRTGMPSRSFAGKRQAPRWGACAIVAVMRDRASTGDAADRGYWLMACFSSASLSFLMSSGVSFGGSSLMMILSIVPVNLNGIW